MVKKHISYGRVRSNIDSRKLSGRGLVLIIVLISISLGASVYMAFKHYEDVVIEDPDGLVRIRRERLKDLQRKQQELEEEYVCYKLIANMNKYYDCPICFMNKFFLLEEEIIKYGITSKGEEGRYGNKYLIEQQISFIAIDSGSLQDMRALELELIGLYPLKEENQVRPGRKGVIQRFKNGEYIVLRYKLARPPQNMRD